MLIYFKVQNYKSFKDSVEFSMIPHEDIFNFEDHILKYGNFSILRTAAIYGSNGAGKTNLFDAIASLQKIVIGRRVQQEDLIVPFKLDTSCINEPTDFEIEYISDDIRYRYCLSIFKVSIVYESLSTINEQGEENLIYERTLGSDEKNTIELKKSFLSEKEEMRLELYAEELDKNKLETFLKFGSTRNFNSLSSAYLWFERQLEVVKPGAHYKDQITFYSNPAMIELSNQIISILDLNIETVVVKLVPAQDLLPEELFADIKRKIDEENGSVIIGKGKLEYHIYKDDKGEYQAGRIQTIHKNGVEFELYEESYGTRKALDVIPGILGALSKKVYLFDEFELGKHPYLTRLLVMAYLVACQNARGQMIFTTHECNLLDLKLFRRDEIWFAERDDEGKSHIYSLSDFEPEESEDLQSDYLNGMFSRIPFLGNINKLNWHGTDSANQKL